jgi:hypothetical protein
VVLGDGYTAAQLPQYAADVTRFCDALLATSPFEATSAAINLFRVDVTSTDSGADDPAACGGTGATAATFFDAAFCNSGTRRLLKVNQTTAIETLNSQVPAWTAAVVIVNSTVYGGSGGSVATFSLDSAATEIGLHELGHSAFGLADEYEYFLGCGIDTDRNAHPPVEPAQVNVTVNINRQTLKWRALVAASTPIPTTRNADCSQCDPQAEPAPPGQVGLFEGADYFHCGAFRPQFTCRMRVLGQPFCAVCLGRIGSILEEHLPRTVPDVRELFQPQAIADILAAGLVPRFTGPGGLRSFVASQSPAAGTTLERGETVSCRLRSGPID